MSQSGIDGLAFDLKSPVEDIRQAAIVELVKLNDIMAIPILKEIAAKDDSVRIRYYAKKGLQFLKKRTEVESHGVFDFGKAGKDELLIRLNETFATGDMEERIGVVQSIVRHERRETLPLLTQLLRNQVDSFVKSKLIMAVGILGDQTCLAEIEPFLRDPDYRIRANSIEAIGSIGGIDACPVLIGCLDDADNRVRANAARELRKFGVELIATTLDSMCVSADVWMRDSAASALVAIESERFLSNIIRLLQDDSESVCIKAAQALEALAAKGVSMAAAISREMVNSRLDSDSAREFMGIAAVSRPARTFASLDDRDFKVRLDTVYSLIAENRTDFVDALLTRLKVEDDRYVLAAIVTALGRLSKAERVRDTLLFHLSSDHSRVRANAVEALGNFTDDNCTARLLEMLGDGNNRVRGNAILSLKGRPGVDLLSPIADMVRSNNRFMQRTAVYVILEHEDERAIPFLGELWEIGDEKTRAKVVSALAILSDGGSPTAGELYEKLTSTGDLAGTFVSDLDEAEEIEDKPVQARTTAHASPESLHPDGESRRSKTATASTPALEIFNRDARENIEIDKLVFNLSAEDRPTKVESLKILSEIGDERCLDAVMGRMSDSDEAVRGTARETLAAVKKRIDFSKHLQSLTGAQGGNLTSDNFMILINDSNRDIRLSAVMSVRFCDASFIPQLIFRLKVEGDPFIISALVSTIGLLDDGGHAQTLGKFIYHTDARVRANAVEGLAYTTSGAALPFILLAMGDPTPRVRANVRRALKHFPSQEVFAAAEDLVISSGIDGTRSVIQAGLSLGGETGRNLVAIVLSRTEEEQIFLDMARLVSEVRDPELAKTLISMSDRIEPCRGKLLEAIAESCSGGQVKIEDEIEAFLGKKTLFVSKKPQSGQTISVFPISSDFLISNQVAGVSSSGKLDLLLKELADEATTGDEETRKAAVLKIARITDPLAREVLVGIAEKDKSPVVRYFAKRFLKIAALGTVGSVDTPVKTSSLASALHLRRGVREQIQPQQSREAGPGFWSPGKSGTFMKRVMIVFFLAVVSAGIYEFLPEISTLFTKATDENETWSNIEGGEIGSGYVAGNRSVSAGSENFLTLAGIESVRRVIDGVRPETKGMDSSEDVRAAVKWGDVFERSSKWSKARETYEKAFTANPQSIEIGLRLLRTIRKEGSDPIAAASIANGRIRGYLEALTEENPSSRIMKLSGEGVRNIPWAKLSLGLALTAELKWSQAIESLCGFLKEKPDYPDALLPLALALYKAGDSQVAAEALKKVSEARPYMPGPALVMGLMAQSRGDSDTADKEFDIAKGKGAGRPTVFISSALWAIETGHLKTAWEDCLAVMPFLSGWAGASRIFSEALARLNDPVMAAKCVLLGRQDRKAYDATDLDNFIGASPEGRAKIVFDESFLVDKSFSAFRKSLELEYFQ